MDKIWEEIEKLQKKRERYNEEVNYWKEKRAEIEEKMTELTKKHFGISEGDVLTPYRFLRSIREIVKKG